MNIQDELDHATDKENDTLFNNLLYLSIDNFSYQGKEFNVLDLIQDEDTILDMHSVLLSDGSIFFNGGIVKEVE